MLYDVEARTDLLDVAQREDNPSSYHAGSHGRGRAVEHVEQRAATVVERLQQFEVAHGELVEPNVALLLDACDACDVRELRVLRQLQVLHDCSCSNDGRLEVVDAEALEVLHVEVAREFVACSL